MRVEKRRGRREGGKSKEVMKFMCLYNTQNAVASGKKWLLNVENPKYKMFYGKNGLIVKRPFPFFKHFSKNVHFGSN